MDVYIYMLHVWCFLFVCGLRWLESLTSVRGVRRPLLVLRVCVDMHVCVSRAGCMAAGIWIGAATGR